MPRSVPYDAQFRAVNLTQGVIFRKEHDQDDYICMCINPSLLNLFLR